MLDLTIVTHTHERAAPETSTATPLKHDGPPYCRYAAHRSPFYSSHSLSHPIISLLGRGGNRTLPRHPIKDPLAAAAEALCREHLERLRLGSGRQLHASQ